MARLWEDLLEPFDPVPESRASALVKWHWELDPVEVTRIDTERDDTFRITTAERGDFVLKASHPGDDPHVIGMQSAAMRHVADAGLPAPVVVPSVDGSTHPVEHGRVLRLMPWLPGDILFARWPAEDELPALGETLGTLTHTLASFEHPAAHRTFAWDLRAAQELRDLAELSPTPAVEAALDDLRDAMPAYEALHGQVVHGDFHPGNILVDPQGAVIGILDFADSLFAPRVLDLAIAASYFLPPDGDPVEGVAPFIAGWERVLPLTDDERALLPVLIGGRLAQRILLGAAGAQGRPDVYYAVARTGMLLERWRGAVWPEPS